MRNTLITQINEIIDENIDLKFRNEYLESKIDKENTCCEVEKDDIKLTVLDKKLLKFGKDALRDKVVTNGNINVNKLDDGTYYCTEFEEWAKDSISTYYMPDIFSKDDIINIFCDEFQEKYNKKKAEKIKEYEKNKEV